ncbi:MAG TPA: ribonuclease HI family protein [Terracidiphilus sp.]|jgi:probable phosphoglycerate mutase|nr:ribonuclease HI family protein [Terracidiphilus sp.]
MTGLVIHLFVTGASIPGLVFYGFRVAAATRWSEREAGWEAGPIPLHWKPMTGNLFDETKSGEPAAWFTAHCDGGSRGNPGPAGYGAVIEDGQGRVVARLGEYLGRQTNNYAEYSGLLAVLKWAVENGAKQLRVVSDSELMVNQMKGRYKVGSPTLKPLWEEARRRAARLERFEMRHTLRGGNQEADRLANEAMDRGTGKQGSEVRDQGSGIRDQGSGNAASNPSVRSPVAKPVARPVAQAPRQVLEGYVKNGVVHLLEGELPDGVFVKIVRE